MENFSWLEISGVVVGLCYLWLEYRASIWLWAAGIVMPAIYIFVYHDAGLYADMGISIYYVGAAVYGWLLWMGKKQGNKPLPITRTPKKLILPLAAATAIAFGVIAWVLIRFTDSTVPWLDSLTTSLSIVGLWMLSYKYVEQWLVWIVVDIISGGLYIHKAIYPTAGLYFLYAVIAIFGYIKWKEMMNDGNKALPAT